MSDKMKPLDLNQLIYKYEAVEIGKVNESITSQSEDESSDISDDDLDSDIDSD